MNNYPTGNGKGGWSRGPLVERELHPMKSMLSDIKLIITAPFFFVLFFAVAAWDYIICGKSCDETLADDAD